MHAIECSFLGTFHLLVRLFCTSTPSSALKLHAAAFEMGVK